MPFNRAHSFKLMLAIAAVISASQAMAENEQRLWNCNLNSAGEWDCEVNEELMQQSAQPTSADLPLPTTRPESAVEAHQAPQQAPTDTQTATVETAPAAVAAPINPVRPVRQSTNTASATASEATKQAPTSADLASNNQWECSALEGQWKCQQNAAYGVAARPGQVAVRAVPQTYANLDWYTYSPGEEGYGGTCPGEYREPDMDLNRAMSLQEQQTIFLEALRSSTVLGGITQLEGGINMRQGGRLLSSDEAEYDPESRTASLKGNVSYREQGLLLLADRAEADLNQGNASFSDAEYVMHQEHMRGEAKRIERFGDTRVQMIDGRITFCEPGNNAWAIGAESLEIHTDEGYGEARHATFEVGNVPVLYLPYFYFPINDNRRTGFLYPKISYSDSDGLDIATPYYFNLAPNYDDTFTPRYVSERGVILENEFRYMNRWSMNALSTAYMPDDDKYGSDRWALGIDHTGNPAERWFSRIDYRRISDDDYLDDLDTTNLEIANEDDLDQLGEMRYQADTWQFIGRVHQYQTTDDGTEPYERVPQLLLKGRELALDQHAALDYTADFTAFDRNNDDLTGRERITGSRIHLRPSASYRWERPWSYLEPRATYWYSQYNLNDQPAGWDSNPNLSVPILSLDSGLKFEREYSNALTQTLEPRLKLISAAKEDQSTLPDFDSSRLSFSYYNLFNETGYSGNDNVAGTDQATLGLSSGFYSATGIEQARIALAQAYYFSDRDSSTGLRPGDVEGTEDRSNIALLANWNISPALSLRHDSELDEEDFALVQQNYRLTYQPDDMRLIYLSYRDNSGGRFDDPSDEVRQTDFAFRWPMSPTWNVIGRWQEDLLRNENLETLLGVEYVSCCWKLRLTGRQWVTDTDNSNESDTDSGIFLQFVLRGLGSFGQDGGRGFLEDITGEDENAHETF
ncbi:Outer membrane protein Imp, required for envelope biogenesis [Marinobacterium lacunae]|uniref:LPS-assembly protein LptD n=1 Tax=Marinobacterium lacunae TaxID=1232683 RepID=A0A081FXN6_9GAMM|nr:LPS-assembly protein LptD [Marinobacterium lacunae]KEA63291.1 Outer membrane protein Imp, required for envelope biogenesis [Marinobacterium lacunae]